MTLALITLKTTEHKPKTRPRVSVVRAGPQFGKSKFYVHFSCLFGQNFLKATPSRHNIANLCASLLHCVVRVRWHRKESSHLLSHLLMSFLSLIRSTVRDGVGPSPKRLGPL